MPKEAESSCLDKLRQLGRKTRAASNSGIGDVVSAKCVLQPKIAKNSLKPAMLGVQGRSRSSMLVPPHAARLSICNHSRARLVDSSRNRTFSRGYANLMRSYGGLLEPMGVKPYTVEIYV